MDRRRTGRGVIQRALLFLFALVLCGGIILVGTVLDRATTHALDQMTNLAGGPR